MARRSGDEMRKRVLPIFFLGICLLAVGCPSRQPVAGRGEAAALRSRIDLISGLMDRRGLAARVLEDLVMAVPVGAWLTDMSYDGARVQAKGLAPSNSVVADYIAKLGGSTVLEDVNLQTSVERKIRNRNWREFSVQAAVRGTRGQEPSASGSERSSTSAAG